MAKSNVIIKKEDIVSGLSNLIVMNPLTDNEILGVEDSNYREFRFLNFLKGIQSKDPKFNLTLGIRGQAQYDDSLYLVISLSNNEKKFIQRKTYIKAPGRYYERFFQRGDESDFIWGQEERFIKCIKIIKNEIAQAFIDIELN